MRRDIASYCEAVVAKGAYFVAAHAAKRQSKLTLWQRRLTLWLRTLRNGKVNLLNDKEGCF